MKWKCVWWNKPHLHFDLERPPAWSQLLHQFQCTRSVVVLVNCHIYFGHSGSLVGNMDVASHSGVDICWNTWNIIIIILLLLFLNCGTPICFQMRNVWNCSKTSTGYIIPESLLCGNASQKAPPTRGKKMFSWCMLVIEWPKEAHAQRLSAHRWRSLIFKNDILLMEKKPQVMLINWQRCNASKNNNNNKLPDKKRTAIKYITQNPRPFLIIFILRRRRSLVLHTSVHFCMSKPSRYCRHIRNLLEWNPLRDTSGLNVKRLR